MLVQCLTIMAMGIALRSDIEQNLHLLN